MVFHADDGNGNAFPVWDAQVTETEVFIDGNHPLAGVTLNFAIEIVEIRPATEDEVRQGQALAPVSSPS